MLWLCALVLAACSGRPAENRPADTPRAGMPELPLPSVPDRLTDVTQRANYVLFHFWDGLDMADTARTHNNDFMEQNFSNFLSVFPAADHDGRVAAAARLLATVKTDTAVCGRIVFLAEKYLYDPQSPFCNDEHYIAFLDALLAWDAASPIMKESYAYRRTVARKNLPGTAAADFKLLTRNGRRSSLAAEAAVRELALVVFYDPECEQCAGIMRQIEENRQINALLDEERLSVLAVYAEGERSVWERTKQMLPAGWTVAMATDEIQDSELYVLRAMPTIYLLKSDRTVILKDPSVDAVVAQLALITGSNGAGF